MPLVRIKEAEKPQDRVREATEPDNLLQRLEQHLADLTQEISSQKEKTDFFSEEASPEASSQPLQACISSTRQAIQLLTMTTSQASQADEKTATALLQDGAGSLSVLMHNQGAVQLGQQPAGARLFSCFDNKKDTWALLNEVSQELTRMGSQAATRSRL